MLREQQVAYYESLSRKELAALCTPQVWHTSEGLLVSDSNNTLGVLAKTGRKTIRVEYADVRQVREEDDTFIQAIIETARQLKNRGIYSPIDLWQA